MDAIERKLCELLGQTVALVRSRSRRETDLLDELALESAQVMEFIMEVEDHFEIIIEQESLAEVRTIGHLAGAVREALQ